MKIQIRPILALFALATVIQFPGYAGTHSNGRTITIPGFSGKPAPIFQGNSAMPKNKFYDYSLESTYEGAYEDEYTYIEVYSFRVVFSPAVTEDVIVSYTVTTRYGNFNTYYDYREERVPANTISWHLGDYETYVESSGGSIQTKEVSIDYVAAAD